MFLQVGVSPQLEPSVSLCLVCGEVCSSQMKDAEQEAQTPLASPPLVCWWAAGFHWKRMTATDHLAFTAKSLPAHVHTFSCNCSSDCNAKPETLRTNHWFFENIFLTDWRFWHRWTQACFSMLPHTFSTLKGTFIVTMYQRKYKLKYLK